MTNTESIIPSHLKDLLDRSSIHLNSDQTGALRDLLTRYKTVFSQTSGHTNLAKHNINTGTALLIRRPCRRLPIGMREIEKEELQKMIDRGIIEPSNSPWASNVVLVVKKDDVTIYVAYPLPRVDECLDSFANSKWFSSMDLNSGFW